MTRQHIAITAQKEIVRTWGFWNDLFLRRNAIFQLTDMKMGYDATISNVAFLNMVSYLLFSCDASAEADAEKSEPFAKSQSVSYVRHHPHETLSHHLSSLRTIVLLVFAITSFHYSTNHPSSVLQYEKTLSSFPTGSKKNMVSRIPDDINISPIIGL